MSNIISFILIPNDFIRLCIIYVVTVNFHRQLFHSVDKILSDTMFAICSDINDVLIVDSKMYSVGGL